MKSVVFQNWTNEDFSWTWAGDQYDFPAGSKIMLQDYLAMHFAKHLATREMFKAGHELNTYKHPEFQKMVDKCLCTEAVVVEAKTEAKVAVEIAKANAEAGIEPKRRGRPKKNEMAEEIQEEPQV